MPDRKRDDKDDKAGSIKEEEERVSTHIRAVLEQLKSRCPQPSKEQSSKE